MQKNQIFNKHVLLNHTYDYVGTLYKLIISANSGEILHVLVESQQFGQMFVLAFDKIISIAEEYLIIESRQALADFGSFKGIADGKFLIVDEETVKHLKIEGIIESQIASKNGSPKQSSYFTIMQYDKPEIKKEPVGVSSGMARSVMHDTQTSYFHSDESSLLTEPHPHEEQVKNETPRIWDDEPIKESKGYPPIEFTLSGGNSEGRHFTPEALPVSSRQFLHPQNIFQREEKLRLAKEAISSSQESQTVEFVSKSKELDKLKADIGREKESLHKLNVQHQIVTRELDQVRLELESVEQEKEEGLRSISNGKAEINDLMLQKESLYKEIDAARAELNRVHEEISEQNDKLIQLHKEMESAEQSKANLEHTLQTAQREIEAAEQSKANLEYSLQTAQRELETAEQSIANLGYSLQSAQDGYNDMAELFILQEKRLKQISLNQAEQQSVVAAGFNDAGASEAWGVESAAVRNEPHGARVGGVSEVMPAAPASSGLNENWNQTIGAGDAHELMVAAYPGSPSEATVITHAEGLSENTDFGQTIEIGMPHEPVATANPESFTPNLQIGETNEPRNVGTMHEGETEGLGAPVAYENPVAPMQPETASHPGTVSEQKAESTDLIQNYIDKQREGLIGKTLSRSVADRQGNVLLNAGTVITEQLFDEVSTRHKDAVVELAMFAE